jgi:peptidyl-prolyl cis-trans isomerase C
LENNKMRRNALLFALVLPFALMAADSSRLPSQTFVAKRGAGSITLADVDVVVDEMPPDVRRGFFNNRNRIEATLSKLLLIKQLAAEARQDKLEQDIEVQAQIQLVTDRVLAAARLKQLGEKAPKIDNATLAREAYLADPKKFKEPDLLTARHVLIRSGEGGRDEFAARALAEKIREEALAGKKFEALATEYSEDEGTKTNGGLLPEFGPGKMQKSFEEAAYALNKPGAISPVIRTSYGFHVIQLIGRKTGQQPTFEQVRPQLTAKLAKDHVDRVKQEHVDGLNSMATDTNPDAIESLMTRYANTAAEASGPEKALDPTAAAGEPKH